MGAGRVRRGPAGWNDSARPVSSEGLSQAETSLLAAKDCERVGNLDGAIRAYVAAATSPGTRRQDVAASAEALRRHASILRRRQEYGQAAALCRDLGRDVASVSEARTQLGLETTPRPAPNLGRSGRSA